ncbi:hypothetical protein E4V51_23600, partial [Paenibacillus sp. 28ISP30-2]|nr:hypothetical protein [Paenibacillus sp. 28ISP30-2]
MLDQYAKEQYQIASTLLEDINGEDIRELLLKITIENTRINIFKTNNIEALIKESDNTLLDRLAKALLVRLVFDSELDSVLIDSSALVCAQAFETLTPPHNSELVYSLHDPVFLNRIITS